MKTFLWWTGGVIVISVIVTGIAMIVIAGYESTPQNATTQLNAQENTPDTATEQESRQSSVRIFAMGDIMLGRYVETLIKKNGTGYPFERMHDLLSGHDMVIGNLEGPIVDDAKQTPEGSLQFSFPASAIDVLTSGKITHVSLANNHTLNYGKNGYEETAARLKDSSIAYYGNPSEIDETYIYHGNINEREIILIGVLTLQGVDRKKITGLISSYPKESFIIVTPHWGSEYSTLSNQTQQTLAHELIDAGADAIIGHHPHVVQEIERYNGKFIFYSLGNAIFDQYFSEETQKGLGIGITLNNQAIEYRLHPLKSERSQLQPMSVEEAGIFLKGLSERSVKAPQDQILAGVLAQNTEHSTSTP